jgi:hypothetical protein
MAGFLCLSRIEMACPKLNSGRREVEVEVGVNLPIVMTSRVIGITLSHILEKATRERADS